jgi:hypothetical protein
MSTKSKLAKLPKHQITDFSKVNTSISDSITYYDLPSKGLFNLIKFNPKPKKDKDTDNLLALIMKKMRNKVKSSSKSSASKSRF